MIEKNFPVLIFQTSSTKRNVKVYPVYITFKHTLQLVKHSSFPLYLFIFGQGYKQVSTRLPAKVLTQLSHFIDE